MPLRTSALELDFDGVFHLGPIDFEIDGVTAAILGHNGAGKSTLFQLLTGNNDPDKGTVHIDNERMTPDAAQLKRRVGYLPQHHALPAWASTQSLIRYCAQLYGIDDRKRVTASLQRWDCQNYATRPLAACSHGMQKRVGLALATLNDPSVLILDEPFSGLDLAHIHTLLKCIEQRNDAGQITILATHIAPYAARLAQRCFVMTEGMIEELTDWAASSALERIEMIERRFFAGGEPR